MRLKSATIKDFKRFTDLSITDMPETARLIMLAGPNGSGKSSFFDALSRWHTYSTRGSGWKDDYHMKVENRTTTEWNQRKIQLTFHHPVPADAQAKASSCMQGPRFGTTRSFKLGASKQCQTSLPNHARTV